ncbi:MAG TPA: hypothetical protein VIK53_18245 [Verrucomicrobiae bacterium]
MNPRVKKTVLFVLAAALLFGSGRVQNSLNRDRDRLGMTYTAVLDNAPPMLAFTTVALGGFRGLISNFLWIRANDLQQDDKFFEAAQLANWITDLEPHFAQVWSFQAWNMAWNISVKFKENSPGDYADRWRWVENGIALLRDQGLRYNPDTTLLYQQLGWIFQSKMGQNLDDGNMYYKREWAEEMTPFFGPDGTNFAALLHPQTAEEKTNVMVLREQYKIDPVFAEKVNEEWGPLDWRLPEAQAIYWGALGLEKAKENPGKVKADDLIQLRRLIYQSMLQAFQHGRIISDPFNHTYALGPDLDIVDKVNDAYEKMYAEETDHSQQDGILTAQRNFLRDAVYFLYEADRMAEAQRWFKYLGDKFPDKPILENDPKSLPKTLTLDEYAVGVVQIDIGETSRDRVTSAIEGLIAHSYYELALGNDDRYLNFSQLAKRVYDRYTNKTSRYGGDRVKLPPYDELNHEALSNLLDPQQGMPYAARARLRTLRSMPPETNALPATVSTNAAPPAVNSTNTVPAGTNHPAPAARP